MATNVQGKLRITGIKVYPGDLERMRAKLKGRSFSSWVRAQMRAYLGTELDSSEYRRFMKEEILEILRTHGDMTYKELGQMLRVGWEEVAMVCGEMEKESLLAEADFREEDLTDA